jgi:hypothetical protein
MKIVAPVDGVINILTNFRSQGTFGRAGAPPFSTVSAATAMRCSPAICCATHRAGGGGTA